MMRINPNYIIAGIEDPPPKVEDALAHLTHQDRAELAAQFVNLIINFLLAKELSHEKSSQ